MAERPLYEVAREVRKAWPKVYFGAVPYLDAMAEMSSVNENYYDDPGKSVVRYFLANASTFRGEDAKRLKAELKKMLGDK